jgi:hypothetical protein
LHHFQLLLPVHTFLQAGFSSFSGSTFFSKMHFTTPFLIALAGSVSLVSAAPAIFRSAYTRKRADDNINLTVLKFAALLEDLETKFYEDALAKFKEEDFKTAGFSSSAVAAEQFSSIQNDESTHAVVLKAGLKSFASGPIEGCTFDFGDALKDVATMAATARLIENVGVSAYLGAAPLLTDAGLLSAAASIATVEARHQTTLNILNAGTAISNAFDMALTPSEVLALAGGFVKGCDPGLPANPVLTVTSTDPLKPGVKVSFAEIEGFPSESLSCHMMVGGASESIVQPFNDCIVPEGIEGLVYLFATNDTQPLLNNVRDRFPGNIRAGPTAGFVDLKQQSLGALARGGSSESSGESSSKGSSKGSSEGAITSTSTATISPAAASSIIEAEGSKATGTSSSETPKQTSSGFPNSSSSGGSASGPGQPNFQTGPSTDKIVNVIGWSM